MILKTIRLSAVGLALLATTAAVHADGIDILRATLVEANQKTPEISTGELRRILVDGSATVLDTRSRAEFDAGHIPGAQNLDVPAAEQITAIEQLVGGNKSAPLVLYCNGPFCQASRRLGEQLAAAGFNHVRRYQLGIPVWRALGGPIAIEVAGIKRIFDVDRTAVFIDARSTIEFRKGSIPGAQNAPLSEVTAGKVKAPLPEDDFNRRIILFGHDGSQARQLADLLSKRPWHNVAYFSGPFDALIAALGHP